MGDAPRRAHGRGEPHAAFVPHAARLPSQGSRTDASSGAGLEVRPRQRERLVIPFGKRENQFELVVFIHLPCLPASRASRKRGPSASPLRELLRGLRRRPDGDPAERATPASLLFAGQRNSPHACPLPSITTYPRASSSSVAIPRHDNAPAGPCEGACRIGSSCGRGDQPATEAAWMPSTAVFSVASKSASDWRALRPSDRAREKEAIMPLFFARSSLASSRV
ncbi:hypothetical protein SAMN05443573_104262 [Celeribacter indicus]|nr:hypothetical protein SAMN05443573_104262 [Celeribacter indicus]